MVCVVRTEACPVIVGIGTGVLENVVLDAVLLVGLVSAFYDLLQMILEIHTAQLG